MLDIKFIRENSEVMKKACQLKNIKLDIDHLLNIDKQLLNKIYFFKKCF